MWWCSPSTRRIGQLCWLSAALGARAGYVITQVPPAPERTTGDIPSPGAIMEARGREWIALPQSSQDKQSEVLRLRPLGGGDRTVAALYWPLEGAFVRPASFHILLLTATPHSGDDKEAFDNLLGLLDPKFAGLNDMRDGQRRKDQRAGLGNYGQLLLPTTSSCNGDTSHYRGGHRRASPRAGAVDGRCFLQPWPAVSP